MASEMASSTLPWLTLSIFVPIVFGLLVLLVGRDDNPGPARVLALVGSIVGLLVTLPLYFCLASRGKAGEKAGRAVSVND